MKRIKVAGTQYTTTSTGAIKMAVAGFLVATTLLAGVMNIGGGESLSESVEWITVEVQQGDTLWAVIERSHTEQGTDTRNLISLYKEEYGTVNIYAGQAITIPVYEGGE